MAGGSRRIGTDTRRTVLWEVEPLGLLLYLVDSWPEADRLRLLIDLDFTDPFFPFDLKVGSDQFDDALHWTSRHVGMGESCIDSIAATRRDAARAHTKNRIVKIVVFGGSADGRELI